MNFIKNIINKITRKKRAKLKCVICDKNIKTNFKIKYFIVDGSCGLYAIHDECDKKLKGAINE